MDDTKRSCRQFTALLGSAAPAPGGGGAAALGGALGAALCTMVAALTTGKKAYDAVEEEIRQLLTECTALQTALLDCVEEDAEGFLPLARVYGMEKSDPARPAAMQMAAEAACRAPLHIMELCMQALSAAERLAAIGSRLAVSDAGCAAALLGGAIRAASLNVFINTRTMTDRAAAERLNARCQLLLEQGTAKADVVFQRVYTDLQER